MHLETHRHAVRPAQVLGLAAGSWLIVMTTALVAATPGVQHRAPATIEPAAPDLLHLAQADATLVEKPVSYSDDQADRGKSRYSKDCTECHGDDLKGGMNGGAPLRGLSFEEKYFEGAPASWMFEYMSNEMPPNSPGRYSPSVYADLMAYILKRNGVQRGAPLPDDLDALDNLIMEK